MKGTMKEIVGQESGFIIWTNEDFSILDNWSSDDTIYTADLRRCRRVNVLNELIRLGAIDIAPEYFDDWEVDEIYNGRRLMFKYREDANAVTAADMDCVGCLYVFDDDRIVIAPVGWN